MSNKVYPSIKNAIILCIIFLGLQIGFGAIAGVIIGLLGIGMDSVQYGIGTIFANLFSFVLVLFIGYKKSHKKFSEVFPLNNVPLSLWIAIIVFMFGVVIVSSEIDNMVSYLIPKPEFFQQMFGTIVENKYLAISVILVGLMPAFGEEMLFRGVILSGFKDNYSAKKAIIVSALLFGIVHMNPWQFVTAFIFGMIIGWVCLKTKSLLLCIYMHLFNNMTAVILSRLEDIIPIKGFNTTSPEYAFQPLWFDAIGIIFAGVGALLFFHRMKKTKADA
jgi:uncharacterized protein